MKQGGVSPSSSAIQEDSQKIKCCKCGKECKLAQQSTKYYQSKSSLYRGTGYIPICKDCLNGLYYEYLDELKDEYEAMRRVCMKFDIYYDRGVMYSSISSNTATNKRIVGSYIKNLNLSLSDKSRGTTVEKTYDDTIKEEFINITKSVEAKSTEVSPTLPVNVKWSETEEENKDTAIEAIGYDPFEGYENIDRKFLFNDLIRYFNEDISDDTYKLSQIIQIVNNNNQIRKIDLIIAKLSENGIHVKSDEIRKLIEVKKKLVESNDKIAKENEISVRNRSDKEVGKSTLGYLQKDLRKKGFKKAESNYYEQLQSEGTYWAINMSHKAVIENSLFDENDKKLIFEQQRKLINDLQNELDHALEKSRLLQIKVDSHKNDGDSDV